MIRAACEPDAADVGASTGLVRRLLANQHHDLVMDAEYEEMWYFFAHVYRARSGEFPDTGSRISRESCPNLDGLFEKLLGV